tara:strand:+ start:36 stop:1043 length:1008 start_codon:yes stop_codon:yes gene_type:complete
MTTVGTMMAKKIEEKGLAYRPLAELIKTDPNVKKFHYGYITRYVSGKYPVPAEVRWPLARALFDTDGERQQFVRLCQEEAWKKETEDVMDKERKRQLKAARERFERKIFPVTIKQIGQRAINVLEERRKRQKLDSLAYVEVETQVDFETVYREIRVVISVFEKEREKNEPPLIVIDSHEGLIGILNTKSGKNDKFGIDDLGRALYSYNKLCQAMKLSKHVLLDYAKDQILAASELTVSANDRIEVDSIRFRSWRSKIDSVVSFLRAGGFMTGEVKEDGEFEVETMDSKRMATYAVNQLRDVVASMKAYEKRAVELQFGKNRMLNMIDKIGNKLLS